MPWRTLCVAVLAITAGCGTFATTNEPTPTVTPVPVTDVPTEQSTPVGIAPGLSGGGVRNVERLADAHLESLEGETYVWESTREIDRLPNRSDDEHVVDQRLRVADDRRYVFSTNRRDFHHQGDVRLLNDVTEFADGETTYKRFVPFGDTGFHYDRKPVKPATEAYAREMAVPIRQFLAVGDATVAEARVDGDLYYRVSANRTKPPGLIQGQNYSVTALVSPNGFVRSMNVTYDVERSERAATVTYQFEFEQLEGVAIERPVWVSEQWSTAEDLDTRHYPRRTTEDGAT
jgi:hypothetical protein